MSLRDIVIIGSGGHAGSLCFPANVDAGKPCTRHTICITTNDEELSRDRQEYRHTLIPQSLRCSIRGVLDLG